MRFVQTFAALSLLATGCGLFKSEPGSSGANAPTMYGAGPLAPSGGQPDASLPPARDDGSTTLNDASPPDAVSHAGGQNWIRFPPSSYSFVKCSWLSTVEGYCHDAPSLLLDTARVNVYQTLDGGKTWSFTCAINSEMPSLDASIEVYILSKTDFWFVAASDKLGSVGHSFDAGKNWTSLTSDIAALVAPAGTTSVPVWQLAVQGGRIWLLPQGNNLAYSENGGIAWRKFTAPADFGAAGQRALVATQNHLFLQYLATDGSLGLYHWNGSAFLSTQATLPASSAGSHSGTWSRAWPAVEGVFFADRGPLPVWSSPFSAHATVDGGKTVVQLLPGATGSTDVVGLSDGLAYAALGSVTATIGGIFTDASAGRFLQIRRTQDAGRTWTTLHSEPSYPGDSSYISFSMDGEGNLHAMHFVASTDGIGPPVIYDGHYVLQ